MPFVTSTEMFKKAYEGGYAIGAFNVNNMEIIQGITEAAKEQNAPLILQVSSGARKYANHTYLLKLVEAAIIETDLPICLHLDHGDTFELCKSCIDGGFTSVMIDGSHHAYEDNVALTKKVVEYAHDHGVVVEGELGRLEGVEDDVKVAAGEGSYTDPDQVQDFVSRTGVDSLAIAVGNAHGNYIRTPELDFDRICKLREVLNIPLVMHGGSDIPNDQLARAVRCGMSKFNIATEYQRAFYNNMKEFFADESNSGAYFKALRAIERPCIDFVKSKIDILNPDHYQL